MNHEELQTIANHAISHFKKKEYDKSSDLFSDLKNKTNSTNFEVLMNLSISEFYKNNCNNPSKLLDELSTIYKSLTIISENNNNTTKNKNLNGEKDIQSSPTLSSQEPLLSQSTTIPTTLTNNNNIEIDNDQALILYNQSVILYLIKQYGTCYANLDILYQNLLFLDDYLAIRICFLLINVCLTSQYYDKATTVLFHLEKTFTHLYYNKENNNNNNNNTLMTPLEFRFMIHFYKSKLYLLSENHYHLAKTEIKNAISTSLTINCPSLLSSCYLLKSNYYSHFSKTKYQKSIDYLNKSTIPINNNNNNNNGNSNIVEPLSFGIDLNVEEIIPQFYYNNLGSLHFNLKKYQSSLFYFSKAFDNSHSNSNNTNTPQFTQKNIDRKTEIFYNTGIVLMMIGKAELAFSCLQESCLQLYSSPLIWLRLAECCILSHLSKQKSSSSSSPDSSNNEQQQIRFITDTSTGITRFILPTNSVRQQGLQLMEDSDVGAATAGLEETDLSRLGTLSLEFAAKCLRNSNYLQSKVLQSLKKSKDQLQQQQQQNQQLNNDSLNNNNNNSTNNNSSSSTPTPELYQNNPKELMLSILISQAYISLCTFNPVITITITKQLLTLCTTFQDEDIEEDTNLTLNDNQQTSPTPKKSINYSKFKYFAHIYAAEACIMLNIPTQAIDFLSPNFIDSIFDDLKQQQEDEEEEEDRNDYKEIFYINLAVAYLLKNDFKNAEKTIQFIDNLIATANNSTLNNNNTQKNNNHKKFNLLKIYLELRKGNLPLAYELIAKERPIPVNNLDVEFDNIDKINNEVN